MNYAQCIESRNKTNENPNTFLQPPPLWGLLCGLTLAVAQLFTPAGLGTAQAATIIISDQASCEAQGFSWISSRCRQYASSLTVAAGDIFTINVSFVTSDFTNNGTINVTGKLYTLYSGVNNGTINLAGSLGTANTACLGSR